MHSVNLLTLTFGCLSGVAPPQGPPARRYDLRIQPRVRLRTTEGSRLHMVLRGKGFAPVQSDDGLWTVEGARVEEIGQIAAHESIPILELTNEAATLEQAYLSLTADQAEYTSVSTTVTQEA
jgi:ABC-2 type transport system ATP-binding protein